MAHRLGHGFFLCGEEVGAHESFLRILVSCLQYSYQHSEPLSRRFVCFESQLRGWAPTGRGYFTTQSSSVCRQAACRTTWAGRSSPLSWFIFWSPTILRRDSANLTVPLRCRHAPTSLNFFVYFLSARGPTSALQYCRSAPSATPSPTTQSRLYITINRLMIRIVNFKRTGGCGAAILRFWMVYTARVGVGEVIKQG